MRWESVAEGVHMFRARPGVHMANSYAIDALDAAGGLLIVEPCATSFDEAAAWIAFLQENRVRAIVLTHLHTDHVMGAPQLAAHCDIPLWLPTESTDDDAFGWRVLRTPGHAPEHICLFNGSTLIAGDMIYGKKRGLIFDADAYEQSLAVIQWLDAVVAVAGHGDPMTGRELGRL